MLRFHKSSTPGAYAAYSGDRMYLVRRVNGEQPWTVSAWTLWRNPGLPDGTTPPSLFPRDEQWRMSAPSKSFGYSVCQSFEALGDDYRIDEHDGKSRLAVAVEMARSDSAAVELVRESLAQMRRGEGKEV